MKHFLGPVGSLVGALLLTMNSASAAFPEDVADVKYRRLASQDYVAASTYALVVDSAAYNASVKCGQPTYTSWRLRNNVRVTAAKAHMSHFGRTNFESVHGAVHGVGDRIERAGKNVGTKWTTDYDCATLQQRISAGHYDLGDAKYALILDDTAKIYGYRWPEPKEAVLDEETGVLKAPIVRHQAAEPIKRELPTHFSGRTR